MKNSTPSKTVNFHLRFQILPGKKLRENAKSLAAFCKAHRIEEVVLFFAGEEWNNGLLSVEEENCWFNAIRQTKTILSASGVSVSLNPWMTTLHCDRGRRFPKGRNFKPMVSPSGEKSRATASFADPEWQAYIRNLYGRFAKLAFRVIWVEDDFRYHNHEPLTWGGGFEPQILERFAGKIGKPVAREELLNKILKQGRPHPWRAKWLETWREIQLETAEILKEAVKESSNGQTQIGLMSSHPAVHSAEGRDWKRLFNAFSINGKVAHRPHFAQYYDLVGKEKAFSIMMLDIQKDFRPSSCEVAPEVENFPFTNWTKSDSLTWADMALCMFHGSDALLLDLFPFSGNRADMEPQIGKLLDRSRPALEWIASRFGKNLQTIGVGMPWRQDASAHVPTLHGHSMEELYVQPFKAGEFLMSYGIPMAARRQQVNAIFGKVAWVLEKSEILDMLKGGLLLDGLAAHILCERGFGSQIGVKISRLAGREEAAYSVETVAAERIGVPKGFYLNHNLVPSVAEMTPLKGAREWTSLLTPDGKRFGSALVVFKNAGGGRVVSLAAADANGLPRNYHRQALIQKAVEFISNGKTPFATVTGGAHLLPMQFTDGKQNYVVIFNGSPDPAAPIVHLSAVNGENKIQATMLTPLGKPKSVPVQIRSVARDTTVHVDRELSYLGFLVLELGVG